jgi:two-component system, OmpR family, sensor histidine kinase KdpD
MARRRRGSGSTGPATSSDGINVQHRESLNDVVAQITGVRVRETVPDSVFQQADEVELVDLPPDDLLHRLKG